MGGPGHRLEHDDVGSGEPTLVFVHGWCCTRAFFEPQVEHFRDRHRVIAVDLTAGRGVTEAADDVAGLCTELGLERPVVIGHSLGGMIAVELAARYPSLPGAVIGLDPGPLHATDEARQIGATFAEQMLGPDGEAVRRAWVEEDAAAGTLDPERRRWIVETMCRVPLEQAAAEIRGLVAWNGVGALAMCRVPLLVVRAGTGGSNAPARLLAIKPDTHIGVTVGAGHFNHLDVPEQVNPMLDRFLALVAG